MHYHRIPHSTLEVSQLGLGTMTFGEQNSEADAHAQLDLAVGSGINLIDTAEMYPVPPRPETQGLTEKYIGSWLKRPAAGIKLFSPVKSPGRRAATMHRFALTWRWIAKIFAKRWTPA